MTADRDEFLATIRLLVGSFQAAAAHYGSGAYVEAQCRVDFLDRLWAALGWDVANTAGLLPHVREVVVEPPIPEGRTKMRADYAFRSQPATGFAFLAEAMRPGVAVDDPRCVFQAKLYAWCAGCPVVVLSSFRQFRTYVIDSVPDAEKPKRGRIATLSCDLDGWVGMAPALFDALSRDAVAAGSLQAIARTAITNPRNRMAVDQAFLGDLMKLRREVGRTLAHARSGIPEEDLDYQAQVFIDRLMFMRVAEDRGARLLGDTTLAAVAGVSAEGAAARVHDAFTRMRQRYNGNLFAETLVDRVELPDASVRDAVRSFIPPDLNYLLNAFRADFLGSVYERYMGLRLARKGEREVQYRACPERIRARGAHYTPSVVVRYMIENSLGRWLWQGPVPSAYERADAGGMKRRRWRSLDAVSKVRLLDPACGSGAFLLAAFDCLLDWYLERARWRPGDVSARERNTLYAYSGRGLEGARPTLKSQIVKTHIFGVDIDSRAIEVARMSLYLRILEDNGGLFPEMHLPDLSENLRCGNALVEPGWVKQGSVDELDVVNAWDPRGIKGFPRIFRQGGFDFVVGNPPYVFGELIGKDEKAAYARYDLGRTGQPDSYKLFYERTVQAFLRGGGIHAFIVPDAILARDEHADVRRWVAARLQVSRVCHVGPVFTSFDLSVRGELDVPRVVGVSSVVLIGRRDEGERTNAAELDEWDEDRVVKTRLLRPGTITDDGSPWSISAHSLWSGKGGLKERLEAAPRRAADLLLAGAAGITRGEELGKSSLQDCEPDGTSARGYVSVYAGADVERHRMRAPSKQTARSGLRKPSAYYAGPKVCFVKTGAGPVAAPCDDDVPALQSVYMLHLGPAAGLVTCEILSAVLCSAPLTAYAYFMWTSGKRVQPQFTIDNVRAFPVPPIDDAAACAIGDGAARLRDLLPRRASAVSPVREQSLDAEIARVERDVDEAICRAFGFELDAFLPAFDEAFSHLPRSQRPRWWTVA